MSGKPVEFSTPQSMQREINRFYILKEEGNMEIGLVYEVDDQSELIITFFPLTFHRDKETRYIKVINVVKNKAMEESKDLNIRRHVESILSGIIEQVLLF